MTIETLAERSGLSPRNIRSYQTRGLLHAPARSSTGRHTAIYDETHLDRLTLIAELRDRGFSLGAIGEMLAIRGDSGGRTSEFIERIGAEVLQGPRRVRIDADDAEFVDSAGLDERLGPLAANPTHLARAISLGLLEPRGDGYVLLSPRLIDAGARLAGVGISMDALLDALDELQSGVHRTLAIIAEDFRRAIWEPTSGATDREGDLEAAIKLVAELPDVTRDAVDAAIAHELKRAPLVRLLTEGIRGRPPTGQ